MPRTSYQRLIVEFLIVFTGVAVALAADEWRQNIRDRGLEEIYLRRVLEDLRNGTEQLEARKPIVDSAIDNAGLLADVLSGDTGPIPEADMIEKFVLSARTGFARASLQHDATYRELNATGRLALIRDSLLIQELSNYYRSVDVLIQEIENNPKDFFERQSRLTGEFAYVFAEDLNRMREGDKARILEALRTDAAEIAEELRYISASIKFNEVRLEPLLAANRSLIGMLERAVE